MHYEELFVGRRQGIQPRETKAKPSGTKGNPICLRFCPSCMILFIRNQKGRRCLQCRTGRNRE